MDAMTVPRSRNSHAPGPAPDRDGGGDITIRVRGLRKRYGDVEAVRAIDLTVRTGEIFAFLGPNGAGKTTTVEMLEGYRRRNAGEVDVLGTDPAQAGRDWRARIGVVLQESQPEAELTAEECLSLYAGYYPRPRPVAETLELVGLTDRRTARCGRMSGGQRRRLDVALALIGDPELIFLDEPTTGFDPAARKSAWDVIAGLRDLGQDGLLDNSLHGGSRIPRRPDRGPGRRADRGRGHRGHPRRARHRSGRRQLHPAARYVRGRPAPLVAAAVTDDPGHQVLARTPSPLPLLGVLAGWAQARHIDLPDLQVHRPTLEDVYLQLTREAR